MVMGVEFYSNNDADYVGLPVLSIEVDPDEMFGFEKGIYVPGKSYYDGYIQGNMSLANYLNGNSAKAKIEYFEPCKDKTYSGDVSITIMRDERRGAEQRSMVIKAESDYPSGTGLDEFLNSSSNYLQLLSGGGDVNSKIRNYFVKGITEGTNVITRDFQPCMVFIDGEFWGSRILISPPEQYHPLGISPNKLLKGRDIINSRKHPANINYCLKYCSHKVSCLMCMCRSINSYSAHRSYAKGKAKPSLPLLLIKCKIQYDRSKHRRSK